MQMLPAEPLTFNDSFPRGDKQGWSIKQLQQKNREGGGEVLPGLLFKMTGSLSQSTVTNRRCNWRSGSRRGFCLPSTTLRTPRTLISGVDSEVGVDCILELTVLYSSITLPCCLRIKCV